MPNQSLTFCLDNCATGTVILPELNPAPECISGDVRFSQVCSVIIKPQAVAPPADWTSPADWAPLIDNTDTTGAFAKRFILEGGLDEPEVTTRDLPKRQTKTISKLFTLTGDIVFLDDLWYEFHRYLECGDTQFDIWFETVGGWLFGGPNGLEVSSMDSTLILGSGRDDVELTRFVTTWEDNGSPDRTASPFA